MNKQIAVMAATLAVLIASGVIVATSGQSAEPPKQEEQPEQPLLNAVMRLDVGPLVTRLARLEAEAAQLRAVAQQMDEKLTAMKESMAKMADALESLKKPERWQYNFLRSTSNTAANRLAEEGWELVTAGPDLLVFRRPAPPKEE